MWMGMRAKKFCVPKLGPSFLALYLKFHFAPEGLKGHVVWGMGGGGSGAQRFWVPKPAQINLLFQVRKPLRRREQSLKQHIGPSTSVSVRVSAFVPGSPPTLTAARAMRCTGIWLHP